MWVFGFGFGLMDYGRIWFFTVYVYAVSWWRWVIHTAVSLQNTHQSPNVHSSIYPTTILPFFWVYYFSRKIVSTYLILLISEVGIELEWFVRRRGGLGGGGKGVLCNAQSSTPIPLPLPPTYPTLPPATHQIQTILSFRTQTFFP